MDTNRREFLTLGACAAFAATAAGCKTGSRFGFGEGGSMSAYADKPMEKIRVGIVGCGSRGTGGCARFCKTPIVEVTALCDTRQVQIDAAKKRLADAKRPAAKEFLGPEAYKALCESGLCDVVYNTTPVNMHLPVAMKALESGLHVFTEVEMTPEVEDNWALVEAAEKYRRHCMMLENCCYSKDEMLMFNLAKAGLLGDIMHGEAGYIHDCRNLVFETIETGELTWRAQALKDRKKIHGNAYPTHGLGPLAQAMDINRGDAFDTIVSMSARGKGFNEYAAAKFGKTSENATYPYIYADMNTSILNTKMGKTIMLQYSTSCPRPYTRMNLLQGTRGTARTYPLRIAFCQKDATEHLSGFFEGEKLKEIQEKYGPKMWGRLEKQAKELGHGGMDYIMDMRWIYCLHQGLPLDINVYDSAVWSCLAGLSQRSVDKGGAPVEIPDFTRGGWKNAKPLTSFDFDPTVIGLKDESKKA